MTTMAALEAPVTTPVSSIPPIEHREAMTLAAAEYERTVELLHSLRGDDWQRRTVCDLWDVRDMAGHMLGMAEAQASMRQFAHDASAARKRKDGIFIDAMTGTQVRERAQLSTEQLVERFAAAAPRAVRARNRVPGLMRSLVRLPQDAPFQAERWTYGFLNDIIFTRDPWIHRLDISRALDREMTLTAAHDGRIVEDVVADWARRHGRPFMLTLTGTAGGSWRSGEAGERLELDALEFCWIVGGRGPGTGLLATRVPF